MTAKILVVDDSITIQKIVAMAFENEDATVEGMGNGSEALTRLQSFRPDIVLADVDMPGLNGFELSREIKESRELKSIAVLLLASDFEDFDENLYHASLADGHITKPFKSEDLVQKVMELRNNVATTVEDNEPEEEVIELSPTDRVDEDTVDEDTVDEDTVDEDTVIDLGADQLMDSPIEELSLEEEEVELDLPHDHYFLGLEVEQDEVISGADEEKILSDLQPEEDLPVEVAPPFDDQVKEKLPDPDESLDELLMRVDELSKKSEEISGNGSQEELSRKEAIDQMLKEVTALKAESFPVASKDEENGDHHFEETRNTPGSESVLAEVDYISEENAEALEAAFNEMIHGKNYPSLATEPSEHQESISLEDAAVAEEHEGPIDETSDSQLPQEKQLNQLLEVEVRRILKQSLTSLIEQELSGLSAKIMRTVEENVRKITPGIAKAIIEKEIDKIKTMKED